MNDYKIKNRDHTLGILIDPLGNEIDLQYCTVMQLQMLKNLNVVEHNYEVAALVRDYEKNHSEYRPVSATVVDLIRISGVVYYLDKWLTVTGYAKKHGITQQGISNRIKRGKIPKEDILELPQFYLKLIKDKTH